MNARRSSATLLFVMFAAVMLLLAACQPAASAPSPQPTQPPAQPSATQATLVTQPPVQLTEAPGGAPGDITLDYSAVAQNVTVATVAAQPASSGLPIWEILPEYRVLTLEGYPVANHLFKPQIFIFPAGELASFNEGAGKIAAGLQTLLQNQQAGDYLPFLPLFNASQVFHAQVQYLDFKSGKGVRFLTEFDQAPLPVNNNELIYTFQGLTGDGKYYIAAVLPVTNPQLPAGSQVSEQQMQELNDFPAYLSKTVDLLEQQPAESFTPDLNKLDALARSIEVK